MESLVSKTDQLKQIIDQLDKLNFSEETYFSFNKADELDEFVQANKQGLVDISKSLLSAAFNKEGKYAMLDYDVFAVNSCFKPTYVEFKAKKPSYVPTKNIKRFDVRNPFGFALYLLGACISLTCIAVGAYTIVQYLTK